MQGTPEKKKMGNLSFRTKYSTVSFYQEYCSVAFFVCTVQYILGVSSGRFSVQFIASTTHDSDMSWVMDPST